MTAACDPNIPARDTAWDPSAMKDRFESVLRTRAGEPLRLQSCRIERFRYRKGRRVVALYELRRLVGTAQHTDWVTGVLYPGSKTARLYSDLLSHTEAIPGDSGDALFPAAFIDDIEMAVQAYPLDRHLPRLNEILTQPDAVMFRATGATPSAGPEPFWTASLARYRPLQSATFRYDARDGDQTYVKSYREGESAAPYHVWTTLGAALREEVGISTPRVRGFDAESETLVLEVARGRSLLSALIDGLNAQQTGAMAAHTMSRLHGATGLPLGGRWTPESTRANAARATAFLAWAVPEQAARLRAAENTVASGYDSGLRAPTHLDAKLDHLFFDGDAPAMIDLDTMDLADPVIDVATIAARLRFLHLTESISVADCRKAAQAFVSSYYSMVGRAPDAAFRGHYANAVLQLSLFVARHQRHNWRDTVARLLAHAEAGSTEFTQ